MSFLRLKYLQKTFPDGTQAVKGINLLIKKGEFIVLLGPSGCGKTTTLRMIAGLETPTAGSIQIDEQDVTNLRPSHRDVGFVFQFYALYPHFTARQNISFPLENIGLPAPERDRIITRISQSLDLVNLLDLHPHELSGGDQQKVSLARAMVRRPALYLMDEPLGALNIEHRLSLREFIRTQQMEMGITTIYVTHDQEEAMGLADRLVVMDAGEIHQVDSPTKVYNNPASLFVANFVGSPGMNLINGKVHFKSKTIGFIPDKTEILIPLFKSFPCGPAVLGIRPEYIHPGSVGVSGKVFLNEFHGNHRLLHLETPIGRLLIRSPKNGNYSPGQTLKVRFDPQHMQVFDAKTGNQFL